MDNRLPGIDEREVTVGPLVFRRGDPKAGKVAVRIVANGLRIGDFILTLWDWERFVEASK